MSELTRMINVLGNLAQALYLTVQSDLYKKLAVDWEVVTPGDVSVFTVRDHSQIPDLSLRGYCIGGEEEVRSAMVNSQKQGQRGLGCKNHRRYNL